MIDNHTSNQALANPLNGASDADRFANHVKSLQDECARLREALAHAERERNRYRKALYENMRGSFQFQDVTLAELEKTTASPVELAD